MIKLSKAHILIIASVIFLVAVFISCGKQIQEMAKPRVLTFAASVATPTLEWVRQFGTQNNDYPQAVCADSSKIYVAGETGWNCFLEKYDAGGDQLWTKQFGTPERDYARGVCMDPSGTYVAGYSDGASGDIYLKKFDADGNELWTRQFGTAAYDYGFGACADASGIYVAGFTYGALPEQMWKGGADAFLVKYDADGTRRWIRQFGTAGYDLALGVCADPSGIYVAGHTNGTLGDQSFGSNDFFVRKFDANGNVLWTTQLGTWSSDYGYAVSTDPSGVYVAGRTYYYGPGSYGGTDIYLGKLDQSNGTLLWTRQYGTSQNEFCQAVSACSSKVYVTGYTYGTFPGQVRIGYSDAFLISYDADGNRLWTMQFGTPRQDEAQAVSAVSSAVYVAGYTYGVFEGETPNGYYDGFLAKFSAGLKATIDLGPDTLNLKAKGKWVTVYIEFPEGYSVNQIDVSTVKLNGEVPAELKPTSVGDNDNDGISDRMVKFDRAAAQNVLEAGEEVEITVTGEFDGKVFEGSDTIRVISKGK